MCLRWGQALHRFWVAGRLHVSISVLAMGAGIASVLVAHGSFG